MDISSPTPKRKRGGCFKAFFLCVGILLLVPLLLLCWLAFLILRPAPPLIISKETTYITEPLTEDGLVDYFKALEQKIYPPEMQTDENGCRVFVRLFGCNYWDETYSYHPDSKDYEFYRLQTYQKLGLDPNIEPTLVLPEDPWDIHSKFYESKNVEAPEYLLGHTPWTLEEYPMLADWIRNIDEPMDAVAEAIRKPVFFLPMLQSPETEQSGKPQSLYDMHGIDTALFRRIARSFQATLINIHLTHIDLARM
jgi:hypothetical protein